MDVVEDFVGVMGFVVEEAPGTRAETVLIVTRKKPRTRWRCILDIEEGNSGGDEKR